MSMKPTCPLKFRSRSLTVLATAALLLATAGCPGPDSRQTRRYKKSMLQDSLQKFETTGLVIGDFPLATNAVLDGDTIRVAGLKSTLRLLAIDTEETFKKEGEKRDFEAGWESYLKKMMGDGRKPVKMATPLGEDGKKFADRFFAGVKTVRLERDHPKEIRDRFDRYLAYVFVKKNGQWVNYNIETVRLGLSPYFAKYSYSRRFHQQFVDAQNEARSKKLGVWDPAKQHYPDYDKRLLWWNARADFIRDFEKEAEGKPNHVVLTNWDSLRRLTDNIDREVVVLGDVGQIKLGDKGPTKVMLSRRRGSDLPLIFFDKDCFGSSGLARYKGEYIVVTGRVTKWYNKFRKQYEIQIGVSLPSQIKLSDKVPNFSSWNPEQPRTPKAPK
jgi:endonuclease YncB( thermonuclease family)